MNNERPSLPEGTTPEVGPYRLLRLLGKGGMGEVFEGYDPRLDRKVAIKRIRAEQLSPEFLERFRREARIGAGLVHSGIVQVFDVSSLGEHEYLVMEYVPGETLRQRVARGPLAIAEGLGLARDIAAALAHAHRRAVVHRDLKTENILIDDEGQAKIADFGISRQHASEMRQLEDPTVTGSHQTPGTVRAMAPEQALGEGTDHRSDLFSFGILLYEMFTGVSPFRAASDIATLSRVVSKPHRPIRELEPALPRRLEALIDQLLEKEPELRPRNADEVRHRLDALRTEVASDPEVSVTRIGDTPAPRPSDRAQLESTTLAPLLPSRQSIAAATGSHRARWRGLGLAPVFGVAGVVLAFLGWLAWRPAAGVTYVAVLAPTLEGTLEDDRADLLTHAVRGALQRSLVSLRGLSPKTFAEIDAIEGTPRDIAVAVAADELVLASLDCRSASCSVELDRVTGHDGAVAWNLAFEIPSDDLALAARAVSYQMRAAYPDHPLRAEAPELEVAHDDYMAFLRVRRSFESSPETTTLDQLLARLEEIRQDSPRFPDAWLLASEMTLARFYRDRREEDLELASSLADQAARLWPADPTPLLLKLRILTVAGQLARAQEILSELEHRIPGDARLLDVGAHLLEARGETHRALEQMQKAARQQPSWHHLFNLATMALRHGRVEVARPALQNLLNRAPDHYDGLSVFAQLELVNGDPATAVELYRRLVERSPGIAELSNLGLAQTLASDLEAACQSYQQAVASAPDNPFLRLNLADARKLVGQGDIAAKEYREVLRLLGDSPRDWQELTVRSQALAHLGESEAAVETIQRALTLAPDNAQVAFEAALVFTLTGDYTIALVNAGRARELGFEDRWFELPWFEPIRPRLLGEKAGP